MYYTFSFGEFGESLASLIQKLILNDYPVYGLAVYGLARGPGHRFHINYFKLNALGSSFVQTAFTFRAQQIQTPGKQKSG